MVIAFGGVDISRSLSIFDFTPGYSDTDSNGEEFEGDGTEKLSLLLVLHY
jgi:hypothetical protein